MSLRSLPCIAIIASSIACSSTSEPARGTESTTDAGDVDAAPGEQVDAAVDAGPTLSPQPVDVPQVGTSCDTFCKSKGTTCSPACKTSDGVAYAGTITDRVDLSLPKYETRMITTCQEVLRAAPTSVGTTASCCCLVAPLRTIEKTLTTSTSCDDVCGAEGLTCEGRGSIDFTRADGTSCSTTTACDERRSPTSSCAQKPSVGAKLTCRCR